MHPEQSIPILVDHGHPRLRLARRNYARLTTNVQTGYVLTEYIGVHLLVAETSGMMCGFPEGDLGPLEYREGVRTMKKTRRQHCNLELQTGLRRIMQRLYLVSTEDQGLEHSIHWSR